MLMMPQSHKSSRTRRELTSFNVTEAEMQKKLEESDLFEFDDGISQISTMDGINKSIYTSHSTEQ